MLPFWHPSLYVSSDAGPVPLPVGHSPALHPSLLHGCAVLPRSGTRFLMSRRMRAECVRCMHMVWYGGHSPALLPSPLRPAPRLPVSLPGPCHAAAARAPWPSLPPSSRRAISTAPRCLARLLHSPTRHFAVFAHPCLAQNNARSHMPASRLRACVTKDDRRRQVTVTAGSRRVSGGGARGGARGIRGATSDPGTL